MTAPRAAGVHLPWEAVPQHVRTWVDDALGAPVVSWADQAGGMSPGCVTRVRTSEGRRAFVKAVGAELNPDTPVLFRREAAVLQRLDEGPLWAALRAAYDARGWVALVLDDVDGRHPDLADDAEMELVTTATDALVARLADEPVPSARASSMTSAPDLVDVRATFARWAGAFDHVDAVPPDLLPGWVRADAPRWQSLARAVSAPGREQLAHWDVRNDNLLVRDGEVVFVDWGCAAVAPPWVDPLLARLERVESPWFDESVRSSPALAEAGDDVVTGWLLGFGMFLAFRSVTATDVGLPTLADFRRRESARSLRGAARRLGLG